MSWEGVLPGGIHGEHGLRRDFAFQPLTGQLEVALEESVCDNMPESVSVCLLASLRHIGEEPVDVAGVAALSVGDRQYLMRQLDALLEGNTRWYSAGCSQCRETFDFQLDLLHLPVKPAGDGYPFTEVDTSQGRCRFRVPTGADQIAISGLSSGEEDCTALLERCLISINGEPVCEEKDFSVSDVNAIDAALEAVAPEICCNIAVRCPHCGSENDVSLNPYAFVGKSSGRLLSEVHKLAMHYHWGEEEILRMPRARRQRYLDMIDATRGFGDAETT